jgi:hypothetical protein
VVIGVAAAARSFLHSGNTPKPSASIGAHPSSGTSSATTDLIPVSAQGFDALNLGDSGDENTNQAMNVINHPGEGWSSQQYLSAALGGLKPGTGLILDMGHTVRLSSVTIRFGTNVGADVQLKLGTSEVRSKGNLDSMATVASKNDIGGTFTFPVTSKATGRYLVIWFTKMPPIGGGKYMAQVFSVSARGTVVSG